MTKYTRVTLLVQSFRCALHWFIGIANPRQDAMLLRSIPPMRLTRAAWIQPWADSRTNRGILQGSTEYHCSSHSASDSHCVTSINSSKRKLYPPSQTQTLIMKVCRAYDMESVPQIWSGSVASSYFQSTEPSSRHVVLMLPIRFLSSWRSKYQENNAVTMVKSFTAEVFPVCDFLVNSVMTNSSEPTFIQAWVCSILNSKKYARLPTRSWEYSDLQAYYCLASHLPKVPTLAESSLNRDMLPSSLQVAFCSLSRNKNKEC